MRMSREYGSDWWPDAVVVLALAAALVWPLFRLEYLDNWSSIESTFIADGRLLGEFWLHHLWQPLWYCGTRADYVYPPGLSLAVAAASPWLHISPARAYHLTIGVFYVLGILGVYLWTRAATGSRSSAWLAAAGVALVSPCLLVLPEYRNDTPLRVPWRLHVLMTYGEGPHMSALAVLPLVWLSAWRRFCGGGLHWLVLSAAAAATVVTINFYGATALAITFTLLVWSCFLERLDRWILRDAILIGGLSYGLTAWWLAPSYLGITSRNLRFVAPAGNSWSIPLFALIVSAYAGLSLWMRRRRTFQPYAFFIFSTLGFLALYVLGYRWGGFQVAGNALRLAPELDLFAILCVVRISVWLWEKRGSSGFRRLSQAAVVLLLALSLRPSWRYLKHASAEFPPDPQWRERVEYRTPAWLQEHFPNQRAFVTGTLRFWYNVWQNGQQADGGSDQGILNPLIPAAKWRIIHSSDIATIQDCLQAFGVDILVVPGPRSREPFKEFPHPEMFDGHLALIRDDGEGNRYYRIPRRSTGIVRVVDSAQMRSVPTLPREPSDAQFRNYAQAVEAVPQGDASPERAQGHWQGSDLLEVDVDLQGQESLLIQETFDPYWRASIDGHPQAITPDAAGFMLLQAPAGKHSIRLKFDTPREVSAGRALTAASLLLCVLFGLYRFARTPHRRIAAL